jgi:hypothetical protein
VRALLLDVRLRHDLGREVQPFTEILETLGGEGIVVPLPGELGLDVAARVEGLESLDDLGVVSGGGNIKENEKNVRRGSLSRSVDVGGGCSSFARRRHPLERLLDCAMHVNW